MRFLSLIILFFLFQSCSFDNKSGIWNNQNKKQTSKNDVFKDFKTINSRNTSFDKEMPIDKNFKFILFDKIKNEKWSDIFYDKSNNTKNFSYNDLDKVSLKTKKITKFDIGQFILFQNNHVILNDENGSLIIYSLQEKKIINKFNFYKKKHRNIKKSLNLIIENSIIYVSDNLGYLYAFDFLNKKLVWAKDYKIPFRSNLKIFKNKLIAANQNNTLYFFEKKTGNLIKKFPTEETSVKTNFRNNISINEKFLFFLNTYGSLYAINNNTLQVSWFLNLNQSLDINPNNLFIGSQIIAYKNKILVSSSEFTYILDSKTGSILQKTNFSPQIKSFVLKDYYFLVSKNNLLILMDLNTGKLVYSYDINKKIANFLNIKKREVVLKNMFMINNKIFIFLENSYLLKFKLNGELEQVDKLPSKINTNPIFVNNSMIYVDNKNKVNVIN